MTSGCTSAVRPQHCARDPTTSRAFGDRARGGPSPPSIARPMRRHCAIVVFHAYSIPVAGGSAVNFAFSGYCFVLYCIQNQGSLLTDPGSTATIDIRLQYNTVRSTVQYLRRIVDHQASFTRWQEAISVSSTNMRLGASRMVLQSCDQPDLASHLQSINARILHF
jgi:hypothetical protein